jgi:hypothetical protein
MYWNFVAIDGVIKNQLDKYGFSILKMGEISFFDIVDNHLPDYTAPYYRTRCDIKLNFFIVLHLCLKQTYALLDMQFRKQANCFWILLFNVMGTCGHSKPDFKSTERGNSLPLLRITSRYSFWFRYAWKVSVFDNFIRRSDVKGVCFCPAVITDERKKNTTTWIYKPLWPTHGHSAIQTGNKN